MVAVLHVEGSPAGKRWLWCLGSHIPQRFCLGWLHPPFAALSRNIGQGQPSPHPRPDWARGHIPPQSTGAGEKGVS